MTTIVENIQKDTNQDPFGSVEFFENIGQNKYSH